ncbi:NUDIX hydrolase [Candidatus Beckwithbacteria bacterium]|nr:NUDIX hydrolase [Candidatus Beckwithbacteria bacterium]
MQQIYPAVKAIILHNHKFLIIRQIVAGQEVWDLPGGKVDYGESPYDTLFREVKEELDMEVIIVKPVGLWWFFRLGDAVQIICSTFLCKPKNTKIDLAKNPAQENIAEYRWVSKKDFLSSKYKTGHKSLKQLIMGLEI